jgi:hypothetical protein
VRGSGTIRQIRLVESKKILPGSGIAQGYGVGAFFVASDTKVSDIIDGTSKTVVYTEEIKTDPNDWRTTWWDDIDCFVMTTDTPNTSAPDQFQDGRCVSLPETPCVPGVGTPNQTYAARSRHPGGVFGTLADGSVSFFVDEIDIRVWRGWGTINGTEPSE